MQIQYEHGQETYALEVQPGENFFDVTFAENQFKVDVLSSDTHSVRLKINGKNYQVFLAARGDERFLNINGRNHILKKLSARKRAGGGQAKGAQDLTAPMPGKVLKLMVQNDDLVEEGQALLILEAMKMEYTIKAHCTGKVFGLTLNEGDQVDLGQVLLDIDSGDEESA